MAEKPSIAKEVSRVLSGGKFVARNSKNKYVKNYDFQFVFPSVGSCEVTMTLVLGHITKHDFPQEYGWNRCAPGALFSAPINVTVDKQDVHQNIASEARNAQKLMIWTDCDREGEYIGYEIVEAAAKYNNRITTQNLWRSQFSHLERLHVLHAAKNPGSLDMKAVNAVSCRLEIDLRVGLSFLRFLTDLFRSKNVYKDKVISYGTCQFPTLGFVVDRYNRVKNFTPEPFWYIAIDIKKDDQKVPFTWTKGHFFDRLYVTLLYQQCLKHQKGVVKSVIKKPTLKWRPLPLTTVELQKDCARFFRISAKKALDAAEQLYNKGFVLYPRTETDRFPATMDLKVLIEKQAQDSRWGDYANRLLLLDFRTPRGGNNDDKAHPPIHPVNYVNVDSLSGDQKKVYEYIVRRYLACCSDDAKGEQNTATLLWGEELFTASGLVVTARNFLDVYTYTKWESTKQLPSLSQGEEVTITNGKMKEGQTSAPQHMTEPELISLMNVNGIGTDATIAEHIEKILFREYVQKEKQGSKEWIVPTELGMGLIEGFNEVGFDNISLSKPFLRKRLEGLLEEIVQGTKTKPAVAEELVKLYREAFVLSNQKSETIIRKVREVQSAVAAR